MTFNQINKSMKLALEGSPNLKLYHFYYILRLSTINVHNCLVVSGASSNVMPLSVCRKINGQPTPSSCKMIQFKRSIVKVVGEMKNVLIQLSVDERVFLFIDIMGVDHIP